LVGLRFVDDFSSHSFVAGLGFGVAIVKWSFITYFSTVRFLFAGISIGFESELTVLAAVLTWPVVVLSLILLLLFVYQRRWYKVLVLLLSATA
jgi:hypothetical protein